MPTQRKICPLATFRISVQPLSAAFVAPKTANLHNSDPHIFLQQYSTHMMNRRCTADGGKSSHCYLPVSTRPGLLFHQVPMCRIELISFKLKQATSPRLGATASLELELHIFQQVETVRQLNLCCFSRVLWAYAFE